jgi:hypothetical protein
MSDTRFVSEQSQKVTYSLGDFEFFCILTLWMPSHYWPVAVI